MVEWWTGALQQGLPRPVPSLFTLSFGNRPHATVTYQVFCIGASRGLEAITAVPSPFCDFSTPALHIECLEDEDSLDCSPEKDNWRDSRGQQTWIGALQAVGAAPRAMARQKTSNLRKNRRRLGALVDWHACLHRDQGKHCHARRLPSTTYVVG